MKGVDAYQCSYTSIAGTNGDWKITVMKDRTLVDLELIAPTAQEQSAQLLELAQSIVGKV